MLNSGLVIVIHKGKSLLETAYFDVVHVKLRAGILAVAKPQKADPNGRKMAHA